MELSLSFEDHESVNAPSNNCFLTCYRQYYTFCKQKLEHAKQRRAEAIKNGFAYLASIIYAYSCWSILLTILLTTLLGTGLIPGYANSIEGADKLYSLQRSTARDHGFLHSVLFRESRGRQSYILISASGESTKNDRYNSTMPERRRSKQHNNQQDSNILSWDYIKVAFQLDALARGKILDPKTGLRIGVPPENTAQQRNFGKTDGQISIGSTQPLYHTDTSANSSSSPLRLSPHKASMLEQWNNLITYEDLCLRKGDGRCVTSGLLDLFDLSQINSQLPLPQLVMLNGMIADFAHRIYFPAHLFLGGIQSSPCIRPVPLNVLQSLTSRTVSSSILDPSKFDIDVKRSQMTFECIEKAKAFLLIYTLYDTPDYRNINEQWESMFVKVFKHIRHWGPARVSFNSFRSRDDELRASTSESGDIIYVVLTFVSTFAYCALVNFSCDLYQAKALVAMTGALAAMLGLVAGMGLCCHLGLATVPTAFVCPFLVLGIGVDDTFVILNSYSLTVSLIGSPEERCRLCLRDCGIAITLTTITSLISFVIGSWSAYLSIRNFCLFCGASLLFGYVFCFTFFFAFLCLDARRETDRRICCFNMNNCCRRQTLSNKSNNNRTSLNLPNCTMPNDTFIFNVVIRLRDAYSSSLSSDSILEHNPYNITSPSKLQKIRHHMANTLDPPGNVGRRWRRFLLRYYGPLLMKPFTKIAVITAFLLLLAISIWGFLELESGLDLRDLAPMHSHVRAFDADIELFFGVYDAPADIGFTDANTPWWALQYLVNVQRLERELIQRKLALKVVNPLLLIAGDVKYSTWISSGNKDAFEKVLFSALTAPDSPYDEFQLFFVWEGRRLRAWKITIFPPYMHSSNQRALWMVELRKVCRRYSTFFVPKSALIGQSNTGDEETVEKYRTQIIPWNFMMVYYESDLRIPFSVVTELSTAGVTLSIVALMGLPDITSGSIVTAVMAMIDIGVFGFMRYWDVKLNMVSMVNLLISIGFAVDYSTHVCHTFLECQGPTRNARVIEAIALMGNPIFHGAVASFIGIVMLGFSESIIFRIFFKMMTLIVVFGMAYGVVFLPVVLSIIGSETVHTFGAERQEPFSYENGALHTLTQTNSSWSSRSCSKAALNSENLKAAMSTVIYSPCKLTPNSYNTDTSLLTASVSKEFSNSSSMLSNDNSASFNSTVPLETAIDDDADDDESLQENCLNDDDVVPSSRRSNLLMRHRHLASESDQFSNNQLVNDYQDAVTKNNSSTTHLHPYYHYHHHHHPTLKELPLATQSNVKLRRFSFNKTIDDKFYQGAAIIGRTYNGSKMLNEEESWNDDNFSDIQPSMNSEESANKNCKSTSYSQDNNYYLQ